MALLPEESHHLEVERVGVGEPIFLGNGRGQLFRGLYLGKRDGKHWVEIEVQVREERPSFTISVWQAFLHSPSRLDWLVEKLTEIGVSKIGFFPAQRSLVSKVSPQRVERWRKIVLSACKQSNRLTFPEIAGIENWDALLALLEKSSGVVLLADPSASKTLRDIFLETPGEKIWSLVIGPEGDLTEEEKRIISALSQTRRVRLLSKILRSETAAIFGASVLVSFLDGAYANSH